MNSLVIRNELHSYIDIIPEETLSILKPLLSFFAGEQTIIETDLTPEEKAIIAEGRIQRKKHPEDFVPFESIL
jgi:hypothetical protein